MFGRELLITIAAVAASGCISHSHLDKRNGKVPEVDVAEEWSDPSSGLPAGAWPETVKPNRLAGAVNRNAPVVAITNATILTGTGERIQDGTLITRVGAIEYVGRARPVPPGAEVIDAGGRFVTAGLIDTHSHIGVYAAPSAAAHQDGNEAVGPVTPFARAQYGYNPQDPAITRARAGGVTTALILPGSANLIGGRGFTVVMRPGRSADEVAFPGAPPSIKMACGENPKRVYGDKGGPQTRMAEYAMFRAAFQRAAEYQTKWNKYRADLAVWKKKQARAAVLDARRGKRRKVKAETPPEPPARDLGLETLAGVLSGDILVNIHCYRAGEIREMVAIADEYNFKIRSFHHALEAYKVRDLLVDHDISISTWADWWGFKLEAYDGIPENAALFAEQGGRPVLHSDSSIWGQRLNQEAAKAMYAGRAAGVQVTEQEALRWVTANPAWALGIEDVTGTLEVGKRADVVVWSEHPFSVYSLPDVVMQAGEVTYERERGMVPTDFELGAGSGAATEVTR